MLTLIVVLLLACLGMVTAVALLLKHLRQGGATDFVLAIGDGGILFWLGNFAFRIMKELRKRHGAG